MTSLATSLRHTTRAPCINPRCVHCWTRDGSITPDIATHYIRESISPATDIQRIHTAYAWTGGDGVEGALERSRPVHVYEKRTEREEQSEIWIRGDMCAASVMAPS